MRVTDEEYTEVFGAAAERQRAERAEFCLALVTACFVNRIGEVHALLWPGPVAGQDGKMYDGTDAVKAVRHDMIRKLFHR